MKKLFLSLTTILIICNLSFAQTTAMDFTKDDCSTGISHNLFADLDSGYTIIQAFDMIPNCQLCIDAATELQIIRDNFEQSNPGKVRWYTTGYLDSYTCAGITDWATNHAFTPDAEFSTGSAEVAYYGGMGMPTIVVLGGTDHHVYYQHLGYSSSQIGAINNAINASLSAWNAVATLPDPGSNFDIFPNPAKDHFTVFIYVKEASTLSIELFNLAGQKIQDVYKANTSTGQIQKEINTAFFADGMYFLKATVNGVSNYFKINITK